MKRLNLNTDKNLTENSNILASSQQALKYYIDQKRVLLNYLQATEPTSFSAGEKWLNTSSNKIFTALSSSTWDNGIDLESGQVYSFNNLLYHWNGENLLIYSSGSITETHNNIEVKTWVGTQSEYDAIVTKDPTTEYSITDAYSNLDIILANQTEFNNSSTTKAATPYQVNQKMGNYLPLAGGNLNAGAILRLTNVNNEVTPLAFDTSGYLTVGSKLYVNTETNTNSLIVRSGNVYKSDLSGDTVVWSNDLNAYLPLTGGTLTGDLFIQGSNNKLFGFKRTNSNTNIDIGWDWASNAGSGAAFRSVDATASQGTGNFYIWARNGSGTTAQLIGTPAGSLTWSNSEVQTAAKKGVANGIASLDANIKIPTSQLPLATVSTLGAVQPDGTTITINNGVISASGTGALANTATATNSLTILGTPSTSSYGLNIGQNTSVGTNGSTAIGINAQAGEYGTAVGGGNASNTSANATGYGSVAVGSGAQATATRAIQIGNGTNNTADTVQLGNTTILDANGKIPNTVIPAATSIALGGVMLVYDSATNTLNIKTS